MIVADTSGLLCLLDTGEPEHAKARASLAERTGPLLTTDFVLAETDYLILKRLGARAEQRFMAQVLDGSLAREPVRDEDFRRATEIIERYADAEIGLTDSTLMAVTERLGLPAVLTLDRRHFAPFRDRRGRPFVLLPI